MLQRFANMISIQISPRKSSLLGTIFLFKVTSHSHFAKACQHDFDKKSSPPNPFAWDHFSFKRCTCHSHVAKVCRHDFDTKFSFNIIFALDQFSFKNAPVTHILQRFANMISIQISTPKSSLLVILVP